MVCVPGEVRLDSTVAPLSRRHKAIVVGREEEEEEREKSGEKRGWWRVEKGIGAVGKGLYRDMMRGRLLTCLGFLAALSDVLFAHLSLFPFPLLSLSHTLASRLSSALEAETWTEFSFQRYNEFREGNRTLFHGLDHIWTRQESSPGWDYPDVVCLLSSCLFAFYLFFFSFAVRFANCEAPMVEMKDGSAVCVYPCKEVIVHVPYALVQLLLFAQDRSICPMAVWK